LRGSPTIKAQSSPPCGKSSPRKTSQVRNDRAPIPRREKG
jgi:hypothetical protein